MATKKLMLKFDAVDVSSMFFEHAYILGIVSPFPDYQLCWHLNNTFDIDFRQNQELQVKFTRKTIEHFYSVFEYRVPGTTIVHYLYNNKYVGDFLLPEYKNLDFIWLIQCDEDEFSDINPIEIVQKLNTLNQVQLATQMQIEKIKNKSYLVF